MNVPELPEVFRATIDDAIWTAAPDFGGAAWVAGRSPDGRSAVVVSRESGRVTFTFPFNEFLYVTRGSATVQPDGGGRIELREGDFFYCREGVRADFVMSDDYEQIAFMYSLTNLIEL